MVIRSIRTAALCCTLAASLPAPVSAQPGLAQNGVINSASRIPTTLAGGPIARGALFTIRGVKFGSVATTSAVLKNGNSTTTIKIVASTRTFVEALMPPSAPLGPSSLIVSVDGKASRPFALEIVAANPGIFSRDGTGWGPGRIENITAAGSRVENSDAHPAAPGSRIAMVATGMGNLSSIEVLIGDKSATGRVAPMHARSARLGEVEIVVRVPADAMAGCFVPLALRAAPARASNFVTLAVGPANSHCDPGPLPQVTDEKIGVAVFVRSKMRAIRAGVPETIRDHARVTFLNASTYTLRTPFRLMPPVGACAAYTGTFEAGNQSTDFSIGSISPVTEMEGHGLDGGAPLRLQRANQVRRIELVQPGYYREGAIKNQPLFLDPGSLVLSGPGGKQVGPFAANLTIPSEFAWIDREQTKVVDRSHGVTLHWKPGSPDQAMFIMASNVDQITTAIGSCICSINASAGQFTIPPTMLANIPASQDVAGVPYDELLLGASTANPGLNASGLTRGFLITLLAVGRYVEYR